MGVFPKEEKAAQEELSGPQAPSSEDPNFPLYSSYRNAILSLVYFSMHVFFVHYV
jgi:hypothetical protein